MTTPDEVRADLERTAEGRRQLYQSYVQFWHPVAYADEVGEQPFAVRLLGRDLVIARLGGEPRAFYDRCVHRGTPLSLGRVEGDILRCAYHGWAYDCRGACLDVPSVPGLTPPSKAQLIEFRCVEACGLIWVSLVDEPVMPLPQFPYLDDPAFRVITMKRYDWNCSAARRLENVLDYAHFPWVHDGMLGYRDKPAVPEHRIERSDTEIRVDIDMEEPVDTGKNSAIGLTGESVLTTKSYRVFLPFSAINQQEFPNGARYILFWAFSPIDETTTRCFTFHARNFSKDEQTDAETMAFTQRVVDDDRPIVEAQRPQDLPFDITAELHIRKADALSVPDRTTTSRRPPTSMSSSAPLSASRSASTPSNWCLPTVATSPDSPPAPTLTLNFRTGWSGSTHCATPSTNAIDMSSAYSVTPRAVAGRFRCMTTCVSASR